MVELVLLACLIREPAHCEEFRIPFAAAMETPQCVWQSQLRAAQWSGDHPLWIVRKFRCELPRA
jgi:acyl-ACP thioesterase